MMLLMLMLIIIIIITGIEVHRPNLLLGLIIRQKLKRQMSAVATTSASHAEENPENPPANGTPPEKKSKLSKPEVLPTEEVEKEEENDFFNSFTTVLHKQRLKSKSEQSNSEEVTVSEPAVEPIKLEPPKPLRFLPGVLVGWESQPSTLELVSKPLPVDDILQSLLGTTGQITEHTQPAEDQSATEDQPLLDKPATIVEEKMDIPVITAVDEEAKSEKEELKDSTGNNNSAADVPGANVSGSSGNLTSLSLKGKPPDVSTEAFLANLAILSPSKEAKETTESTVNLGNAENISQESQKTTDYPELSGTGQGVGSNNSGLAIVDSSTTNSSKSPQFINLKRDPRQAAGRSQQNNASENEGDSVRNDEIQNNQQPDSSEREQMKTENKQPSTNDQNKTSISAISTAGTVCSSQLEESNQLHEEAVMQSIETVHSVRRGLLSPPQSSSSQFGTENSCHSEFSTKIPSPVASGNFSPIRTQQPNFQHAKATPPSFQFQGAVTPNFPPQNNPMFAFPPHLPPPLLPPPGFGFAQNPLMPWPPVIHLSGQPPFVGPVAAPPPPPPAHKQSRFSGPEHFYQSRDNRRPDRRHSDPWGRPGQRMERAFNRRKSDQHRQSFYSESHHPKRGRHDWESDSERNRHRERDRKSREEGHRDKERSRLSHSDKDSEGKSSRESRNPEKKDAKSEERAHEREKSRERHRERDSEKTRDRHHKDRDHGDRGKSKR